MHVSEERGGGYMHVSGGGHMHVSGVSVNPFKPAKNVRVGCRV